MYKHIGFVSEIELSEIEVGEDTKLHLMFKPCTVTSDIEEVMTRFRLLETYRGNEEKIFTIQLEKK